MNLRTIFLAVIVSLATAQAQIIRHNQVQPFPQPVPVTASEKAAIKFKPQLRVTEGCHPYPAVQQDGSISGGLQWGGALDGDCTGSVLGSQIYARSVWVNDVWAIMYAWYFPKGQSKMFAPIISRWFGHRHNWKYVIVWIDNPDKDSSTILSVSVPESVGYEHQNPVEEKYLNGTSTKIQYYYNDLVGYPALQLTEVAGEFQDLITWEQLPSMARYSLNYTDWDTVKMPLKDGVFNDILENAWPF